MSRQALRFAVDERFSPLRINCEPVLKTQNDASVLVKELLKQIEPNFRKLNPRYGNPLGFNHYTVDENGNLVCYTKSIELFIFMCDNSNYPPMVNNTIIRPSLPKRLPARNAIILKFIDNKIKFEEIQSTVNEKLKSVYAVEEMLGTMTYRSRHIRIDLLSTDEYTTVLNSGKFVIDGHLYEVDEYLPSPKLLICNKCNTPGHIRKNCRSEIEVCKRCGKDRNDGSNHKICIVKCHHCGDDHEATKYSCTTITKFRHELLNQLKNNTHLLPPHVQFYIPQQLRDKRGMKLLMRKNDINPSQSQRGNTINVNPNDYNAWPSLNPTPTTNNTMIFWNAELKKLHDEFHDLKKEHDNEIEQIKTKNEKQTQKMTQEWQLFNLQVKTQAEAISDIYTTVAEILPPMIQCIQIMNQVMNEMNSVTGDDKERQARGNMITSVNATINTFNNRLLLLANHQQKLKTTMDKQNELMSRSMYSNVRSSNEL